MNIIKTIFGCRHPAKLLNVEKDATIESIDDLFDHITYHLVCGICSEKIDITYAKPTKKFYNYKEK